MCIIPTIILAGVFVLGCYVCAPRYKLSDNDKYAPPKPNKGKSKEVVVSDD